MLCQNETGVLSGSELFFHTTDLTTRRLFFYINSCGHYHCENGYKVRRNHMENLLLIYIEQGTFYVEYQNKSYHAQAGDILLMDGTFPQFYGTHDYAEFYWIHIAGSNAFELYDHLTKIRDGILHRLTYREEIVGLIRYLVSEFKNNQTISASAHSCMLYRILCGLMENTKSVVETESDSLVQKAIHYIDAHLGEDLNLKRLAAEVHISPSHLIRVFRQEVGRSPHEYIVLARMDRAKYLLKTTSRPIKTIASEVGYRNESSFTGTFTDKIGISPRKFRELPLG